MMDTPILWNEVEWKKKELWRVSKQQLLIKLDLEFMHELTNPKRRRPEYNLTPRSAQKTKAAYLVISHHKY